MKCAPGLAFRIAIALTVIAIPALAETSITSCPFNITSSGNYVVNADLICTGSGINITASNVSLNLHGHTIMGSSGDAIHVGNAFGRLDHVGISGPGLIKMTPPNTAVGISLENADYSLVSQVTVVGALTGINASSCNFLTVGSNVIGHSGTGVLVDNSSSIVVARNDASGNTNGIALTATNFTGTNNTVNNNLANGNSNSGISIVFSSTTAYGNVTNGNGQYGIFSPGALHAFKNTSTANGVFDLFDSGGTCTRDQYVDNVFFTSSGACIH